MGMFEIVLMFIGFGICNFIFNAADYMKYKTANISSDYDQEKAVKRIYKNCKRKWTYDKKGTLKAKFGTFEKYVDSCIDNEFAWRRYDERLY